MASSILPDYHTGRRVTRGLLPTARIERPWAWADREGAAGAPRLGEPAVGAETTRSAEPGCRQRRRSHTPAKAQVRRPTAPRASTSAYNILRSAALARHPRSLPKPRPARGSGDCHAPF